MNRANATSGNRTVSKGANGRCPYGQVVPQIELLGTDAGGQLGSHSCFLAPFEPAGLVCFLMLKGHRAA